MNVYEIVTDRIAAMLEKGTVPWRRPWSAGASEPKNLVSGKAYRGVNVLLLGSQGYVSPYWATYKQITQDLGGRVLKGSKGTPVVFFKAGKDDRDPANLKNYFVLRYFTVFNVSQCEFSDPSVVPDASPKPPRHHERVEACEQIVKSYLGAPEISTGHARACYVPVADRVEVPSIDAFEMREEYYSTLFHELAHSTGAKHRLDRGLDISFGSHAYTLEELVAECGAAFLCGKAGIDAATLENSAAYLASWARKLRSEPRWIVTAASKAAKAADLILGVKRSEKESEAA